MLCNNSPEYKTRGLSVRNAKEKWGQRNTGPGTKYNPVSFSFIINQSEPNF